MEQNNPDLYYQSIIKTDYTACYDKSRVYGIPFNSNDAQNISLTGNQNLQNTQNISLNKNQSYLSQESQNSSYTVDESQFEETKCQICLNEIANNPLLCPECHKIFGFSCVQKLINSNQTQQNFAISNQIKCPSCKCIWTQNIEKLKNRFARDIISKQFKIKCKNQSNGCKQNIRCIQEEIIKHQQICAYEKIECVSKSLNKCGWQGFKHEFENHKTACPYQIVICTSCKQENEKYQYFVKDQHYKNCPNTLKQCEYCKLNILTKNLIQHYQFQCKEKQFKCKGCNQLFQREDFLKHEQINCYQIGSEKQMFDKLLDQIQQQKQQQIYLEQQQKIETFKQHYALKLSAKLTDCENKEKILDDFSKGICHVNSLEQIYEIYSSGMKIKSIIINETDLYRYTYSRNSKKDFTQCIELLKKLAEEGDPWSMFSLGLLYYCGDKNIDMNDQKAYEWAKKSSDTQNPGGLCLLGLHYLFGYHVEKNYEIAFKYFEKSTKQLFPPAFYYLGDCYINGKGISKPNQTLGLEHYQVSADLGYPYALKSIGEKYEENILIADGQDQSKVAYQYFLKSAKKGVLGAMQNVKDCLLKGKGVKKNQLQAQIWAKKIEDFKIQEQAQKKEENSNYTSPVNEGNNSSYSSDENQLIQNYGNVSMVSNIIEFNPQSLDQHSQLYNILHQNGSDSN